MKALYSKGIKKNKRGKLLRQAFLTTLVLFAGIPVFAEDAAQTGFLSGFDWDIFLLVVMGVLLLGVFVLMINIKNLERSVKRARGGEEMKAEISRATGLAGFWQSLTDSVPVEREEEVKTDHEYDGIVELDNNLPPWWLAGFYITIAVAVVYLFYYHVYYDGNTSEREFTAEMQQAEQELADRPKEEAVEIDEENLEVLSDPAELETGKQIYTTNCVACHAGDGGGGVGPNLTDEYWVHGGDIQSVYKVIKEGVPSEGMIAWKNQLSPQQMHQVASYVYKLRENPVDGKEPQGEKYTPESGE